MRAALSADIVEWCKVGQDTVTQQQIVDWGNGVITKGPDGGVRLTVSGTPTYVASGKYIVRNREGVYAVFEGNIFEQIFTTFT